MKIAIIGSRNIDLPNLSDYILDNISEIVSGGAKPTLRVAWQFRCRTAVLLFALRKSQTAHSE